MRISKNELGCQIILVSDHLRLFAWFFLLFMRDYVLSRMAERENINRIKSSKKI